MKSFVCIVILVKALGDLIGKAESFFTTCNAPSQRPLAYRPVTGARSRSSPFFSSRREVCVFDRAGLLSKVSLRVANDGEATRSDSSDAAPVTARKPRRKRKEALGFTKKEGAADAEEGAQTGEGSAVPGSSQSAPPPVVVRSSSAVQLEVVDVRDAVAGRTRTSSASAVAPSAPASPTGRREPRREPLRSDATPPTETSASESTRRRSVTMGDDDAFARLLQDAQQMRQAAGGDGAGSSSSSTGFSVPNAAKNAISTLITADFFLICAFLLWFLAGIFASTVLQNDAIQIAFNGIFQPVVQPALGVLMIGSIASAVFKGEEDEDADRPS